MTNSDNEMVTKSAVNCVSAFAYWFMSFVVAGINVEFASVIVGGNTVVGLVCVCISEPPLQIQFPLSSKLILASREEI